MKILIIIVFIALGLNLYAQLYIKPSFTFSHDFFKNDYGNISIRTIQIQNTTISKRESVNFSFGNGNRYGCSLGYKTNKSIGFELGIYYYKGKMDALLLQKIEELTLYTIEQQKQIELLKKEIETIKK